MLGENQLEAGALDLIKRFQQEQLLGGQKKRGFKVTPSHEVLELHKAILSFAKSRAPIDPNKYQAKTINYQIKLEPNQRSVAYSTDKRVSNSVRIRIEVKVDERKKPFEAVVNIYE